MCGLYDRTPEEVEAEARWRRVMWIAIVLSCLLLLA